MGSILRGEAGDIPVSIAGLCVLLICDETSVLEQLQNRYRQYAVRGENPFEVRIYLSDRDTGSTREQVNITESELMVTDQSYEGIIDIERGKSRLMLRGKHGLADIEYFLRLVFAYLGFQAGGFLMHSAGVLREKQSYLFFGPSGSGKSTVANLSDKCSVLNDDLLMLLPDKKQWVAYSTPFWNVGNGLDSQPGYGQVAGLYRLVKDKRNAIMQLSAGEALAELMACIPVLSGAAFFTPGLFQRCTALLNQVPIFRLHFTPDPSFWDVVI